MLKIEVSQMKTHMERIRLTSQEIEKLKTFAEKHNCPRAALIRAFIENLEPCEMLGMFKEVRDDRVNNGRKKGE